MLRWSPLLLPLALASCAVAPAVITRDEDSDRIELELKSEPLDLNAAAVRGIALGSDAPPLAEPFEDPVRHTRQGFPGYYGSGFGGGIGSRLTIGRPNQTQAGGYTQPSTPITRAHFPRL